MNQTQTEKNKILSLAHELYSKWEITDKQLYNTYYELFMKKISQTQKS